MFALLLLFHSEDLGGHLLAEELCEKSLGLHPNYEYIKKIGMDHKLVIEKFDRYPQRLAVLALKITEKE